MGRCEQVNLSPLHRQAGAMHGGEEDASQIRAGRYSQVKHQEHEARRLVGIDESDWERGRKAEIRDGKEQVQVKGRSTPRWQWAVTGKEGEPKGGSRDPKAGHTVRWSRAMAKGAEVWRQCGGEWAGAGPAGGGCR